jgi:hypothetical protein
MTGENDGKTNTVTGSFATDGKRINSRAEMGEGDNKQFLHMIAADGKTYVISDADKTFLTLGDEIEISFAPFTDDGLKRLEKVGEGEEKRDGLTLKFEEFTVDGESFKFYFHNGLFYGIESLDGENKVFLTISNVKENVPDKMFEVPAGYVNVN